MHLIFIKIQSKKGQIFKNTIIAWPFVLCLICAWSAIGIGLGLGAFWVLAGGAIFGGVVAVVSGAGLAGALCACVWRVSGCWGWIADAVWLQCF